MPAKKAAGDKKGAGGSKKRATPKVGPHVGSQQHPASQLHLRSQNVIEKTYSGPKAYFPIGTEVRGYGSFRWPNVRDLSGLEPKDVFKYENLHLEILEWEEVIMLDSCHRKNGQPVWQEFYYYYDNWIVVNSTRPLQQQSLSSAWIRMKRTMEALVQKHNEAIKGKTLQERARMTEDFLRLPRDPPNAKGKPEDQHDHPMLPLCPAECELCLRVRLWPVLCRQDMAIDTSNFLNSVPYEEGMVGPLFAAEAEGDDEGAESEAEEGEELDLEGEIERVVDREQ